MDLSHRLAVSYYKTIATINEQHHVFLVQHQSSNRIFIKKILDVYNIDVYENLYNHPIPGIPQIIDYCEEDHQLILIEEYISGTPLYEKMDHHDITEKDVLNYTLDLCNILEALHSLNPPIIHRDIKPSNIIITNYNHAVLLDFNAAKKFSPEKREDTVLLGTQGYAAPEQYGFGSSSPQTDIYSLGIVIKEMLAACNSNSKKLKFIADQCTQLSPKERYSSVTELKKEVQPLVKSSAEIHAAVKGSTRRFLPPGYRTHTPWKMFLSSVVYIFILWLCLSLEVKNTYGAALWTERLFCLAMMLSVIFGSFNYLNFQRLIPLCRHKNWIVKGIGIVILDFTVIVALFLVLVILESFAFHVV